MKKIRLFATSLLIVGLLASNVFAASDSFVSSVESKEAPAVTETEKVIKVDGKETTVSVKVTGISDKTADAEVSKDLAAAKEDIQKVTSVADLASADGGTIAKDLDKALDVINTANTDTSTKYTAEDLVVTDLFDVSLVDENGKTIQPDADNPVTLTFKTNFTSEDVVIVLHNKATGKWEVIDSSKVKVNADGSVDVEFDSFSPIAFLSVVDDATADESKPADTTKPTTTTTSTKPATGTATVTSPQTGETANGYVVVASLMLLAAAAYCMTRAKRTEC